MPCLILCGSLLDPEARHILIIQILQLKAAVEWTLSGPAVRKGQYAYFAQECFFWLGSRRIQRHRACNYKLWRAMHFTRVLHCLAPLIVPAESVITASLLALVLLFICFSSWVSWAVLSAEKRRHVIALSLSVVWSSEVYLQSFLKFSELQANHCW